MSWDYDGAWADAQADAYDQSLYEQELVDNAIRGISKENVRNYLGQYGDAVQERVDFCLKEAEQLNQNKHYGASVVVSNIAIELMVRFMLVRPLVQGAFLSDEWADILAKRITKGRSADDRDLLPAVLRRWNIDITERLTSSGQSLWQVLRGEVWSKRNSYVHEASPVAAADAVVAIECAKAIQNVVNEIAQHLGFTLGSTGKWCEMQEDGVPMRFDPASPF